MSLVQSGSTIYALVKDARIRSSKEECASDTGQKLRWNNAVVMDAQISSPKEESAFGMGAEIKRKLCSSDGCSNKGVKGGMCIKHGAKGKRQCNNEGCTYIARPHFSERHPMALWLRTGACHPKTITSLENIMRTKMLNYGSISEHTRSHADEDWVIRDKCESIHSLPVQELTRQKVSSPSLCSSCGLEMKLWIVQCQLSLVSQQRKLVVTWNRKLPMM